MMPEQNFGAPVQCAEAENQHEQFHQFDYIPEPTAERGFSQAAQWYLEHTSFRVMPLGRLDNRPHRGLGTFGSFEEVGSRDSAQFDAWWGQNGLDPFANIGIVTGRSVLVLDVDVKHGVDGLRSLMEWEFETGVILPEAPRVITPSGGSHLLFAVDQPCPSPIGWRAGIDVRADGAVVAAPPSRRQVRGFRGDEPAFVPYRLVRGSFDRLPMAPDALVADIQTNRGRFRTGGGSSSQSASSLPPTADLMRDGFRFGERDDGFHTLACRLWRQHWPHEDLIRDVMHTVWTRTDQDSFTWRQVEQKIDGARRFVEPQIMKERSWLTR